MSGGLVVSSSAVPKAAVWYQSGVIQLQFIFKYACTQPLEPQTPILISRTYFICTGYIQGFNFALKSSFLQVCGLTLRLNLTLYSSFMEDLKNVRFIASRSLGGVLQTTNVTMRRV